MAQVRLLTAEDIRDWPGDYELYEGVPRSVAAAPDVSAIAVLLASDILVAARRGRQGFAFGADASFRLLRFPDVVYLPDAAFVRRDRVPTRDALRFPFEGAPDLAAEVRSPSDTMARLDVKMRRYLTAGTRLGWLVDPVGRAVTVYRPDIPAHILRGDDRLSGGIVLAGFDLAVEDVFTLDGAFPPDRP